MDKMLPPEVWCNILKHFGTEKEVANLRLVSRHLKEIVDQHHIVEDIDLNGDVPQLLPHRHVKIGSISSMKNFNRFTQLPMYELNRLKAVKFTGPCQPGIVQKVLASSPQLEEIDINTRVFSTSSVRFQLPGMNSRTPQENQRIKKIKVQKISDIDDYSTNVTANHFTERLFATVRLTGLLQTSLLHPSVRFPSLTNLHLEYRGLPLSVLHELMSNTIIPFVKRHDATLQVVTLCLTTLVHLVTPIPLFARQQALPKTQGQFSMPALYHLDLELPESVLNGVLVALFNNNNNGMFVPRNKLSFLTCEYTPPLVPLKDVFSNCGTPDQDQQAASILQNLFFQNQEKLVELELENFPSNQITLFNQMGFASKAFQNLEYLTIGGRGEQLDPAVGTPTINFQTGLLEQKYPKLEYMFCRGLGIKLNLFRQLMEQRSPNLKQLNVVENYYYGGLKVDDNCLSSIASKDRIMNIWFGPTDLAHPIADPYWDTFKERFAHFTCRIYNDGVAINM